MPKAIRKTHLGNGQTSLDKFLERQRKDLPSPRKENKRIEASVGQFDDVDARGKELGTTPNLIDRIRGDIPTLGVVGEEELSLLVYVGLTSRLLDDPLAIVARGVSGSGKSVLLRRVALLMPPDSIIDAFSLTSASLYNSPEDFLRHKILLMGERKHSHDDQTRDENANLRQLLSEKKVSKYKSVQGEGGWHSELIERDGPVAFAETTTSRSIFEEDLNRMLQIFTNESSSQTRCVMKAVARKYQRTSDKVDVNAILKKHREFQESLEPCSICIPFAEEIAKHIPAEKVRSRRVITQVLATIEAVTLLHQFQREKVEGYLIATRDDYAIARTLLLKPLHASIGLGDIFRKYKEIKKKLRKKQFDSAELGGAGDLNNRMSRKRVLDKLQQLGLIELIARGKGKNQTGGNGPARQSTS